ncbi:MAG: hypothetical protein COB98_04120 [Flavobacteriaceae bacterium]|nr:MAG: hypothetical protein COB98_04120 [Flavobacteriaceae bacterium]
MGEFRNKKNKPKQMNKKSFVLLITLICLLVSCGYEPVKRDTHTALQEFPRHDNNRFRIRKIAYRSHEELRVDDRYIYSKCNVSTQPRVSYMALVVFDKEFNQKRIFEGEYFNVSREGNYVMPYQKTGTEDAIFKVALSEKKGRLIEMLSTQGFYEKIRKEYQEELIQLKLNDSTGRMGNAFLKRMFRSKVKELVSPEKVRNYSRIKDYYVFRYVGGEEKALFDFYFNPEEYGLKEVEELEELKPVITNNFQRFDTAVLGTVSSGNHFVFGFHSTGLDYYSLQFKNDTMRFKIKNNALSRPLLEQFNSPIKNSILLKNTYMLTLYLVDLAPQKTIKKG